MRGLFLSLLFSNALLGAFAQQESNFSLDDCITFALEQNEQLAISRLDIELAASEVRETTAIGLPQVNVGGGLNYNFALQESLVPASVFDPNAAADEEITISLAQKYDGNAAISASQLLFDGSYFVGLQAAKTYKELSVKSNIKNEIDVVEAVSKAYYNALIAEEQLELIEANLSRLDTLLRETEAMYREGFAEKLDVDRIRVSYNNLKVEQTRNSQLQDLSIKLLKFQMGMNLSEPMTLSDQLEDIDVGLPLTSEKDFDYNQRIEYSEVLTNESLAYLDLKNNRSQYLPNLYASFSYGWNTAASSSEQIFRARRWLDFGTIGISTTIPIFDGFLKSNRIQQNKLQIKQLENQKSYLKKSIDLEIEQSTINLSSLLETLDVQKQNVDLAQYVYDISKTKYQEGVGSNTEVIDADTSLKEAQTNYLNSLYEAITSQIELKKALGTLYNNN